MSDSAASRDIVKGAYDAILSGDFRGFLGVFDDGVVVSEPACLPYGGTFTGLDEVKAMLMKAGPVLDSGKMVVEEIVADGDHVVAMLRIPLRDGSADAVIAEYWVFRDGKAVELRVLWQDPTIVPAAA
jgi:ketosteroid isomerase-like protein